MKGNSCANGNSESGASVCNGGPWGASLAQGFDPRPASIWDHLEPGLPR